MSKETWDIVYGVAILVPFLILVFIAAKVLAAFRNAQFNTAFTPLLTLIGGSIHSDGVHGSMTGIYQGNEVGLQITPGARSRMFEGHSNQKRNILVIEMRGLLGQSDWKFDYGKLRVLDQDSWHSSIEGNALERRLSDAGIVAAITGMGNVPAIRYSASQKMLTYIEDIRPALAPSLQRFQKQLELMVHLAGVNNRVNAPTAASPSPSATFIE